ncbi:LOW QUALITY PROTEIN: hypothetical protein ACHAWF_017930 [Thalassiosira exigua]
MPPRNAKTKRKTQSVCKRTRSRSRSRQTSLLDFGGGTAGAAPSRANEANDAPGRRRRAACTATAAASATRSTSSSASASSRTAAAAGERRRPGPRTTKRAAPSVGNDDDEAELDGAKALRKRRRDDAAPASASREPLPPASAEVEPAPRGLGAPAEEEGAESKSKSNEKRRKPRATVCYDVTRASDLRPKTAETANATAKAKVTARAPPESRGDGGTGFDTGFVAQQEQQQQQQQQKQSVTPSPKLPSSEAGSAERSDRSVGGDVEAGRRANAARKKSKWFERTVTVDPVDATPRKRAPKASERMLVTDTKRRSRPEAPAFHHQWMRPYAPAAANFRSSFGKTPSGELGADETDAALPPGVVDVDLPAHSCCPLSSISHAGYSWITSKRRCGCPIDADHNATESATRAYLGSYGAERYGGPGGPGGAEEWAAERAWLDEARGAAARASGAGEGNGNLLKKFTDVYRLDDYRCLRASKGTSPSSSAPARSASASSSSSKPLPPRIVPIPTSVPAHLDYLPRQPHVASDMRAVLVDWLCEVCEEYKLGGECFHLGVALVDRSLACSYDGGEGGKGKDKENDKEGGRAIGGGMVVTKDRLQLLGCLLFELRSVCRKLFSACTLIAAKLVEIAPPTADDFVYISDKTYTRRDVLDMEARVCEALRFRLGFRTPWHYVDRFLRASRAGDSSHATFHDRPDGAGNVLLERLVFYLLDLSALEYKLVPEPPSLVAAGAVYLARAALGLREPDSRDSDSPMSSPGLRRAAGSFWSRTLEHYTGYDKWDLEETVLRLRRLHEGAEESHLASVFNKHKAARNGKVALRTVPNEEDLGFL